MTKLIIILLSAVFINNYVLSRFLGICPFLGVSKKLDSATGMSLAVIFVMLMASAATYPIQVYLLAPNGLGYLQTIVFILVIAALVQLVEIVLKRYIPSLHKSLGVYLPLIVVNCIILGRAEMFANKNKVFDSAVDALGMGAGFTLALSLMAFIREVFGNGTFFGMPIPVLSDNHISILTLAPGGFFVFGLLIAAVNKFSANKPKKKEFGCAGCPSAELCGKAGCNSGKKEAAVND